MVFEGVSITFIDNYPIFIISDCVKSTYQKSTYHPVLGCNLYHYVTSDCVSRKSQHLSRSVWFGGRQFVSENEDKIINMVPSVHIKDGHNINQNIMN